MSQLKFQYGTFLARRLWKVLIFLILLVSMAGCSGCSKSGLRDKSSKRSLSIKRSGFSSPGKSGKTVIKMKKTNGVYQIPVEINGVALYFIFDTGAGLISISVTEANFLYNQGKLNKSDIIGNASFIDAKGEISEGTIILLKTVTLGNKTITNIEASVVHNLKAPLLFGQSALERFGKISIDYNNGEITFEE